MDLIEHYSRELSRLKQSAQEFSERHPRQASYLGGHASDPDVERLLEGVAFLLAGFQARIDQTSGLLAQQLASIVAPHLLRQLPASTIVEFKARTGALTKRHTIEKGRALESKPVDGTPCSFQTTFDVDLWPIDITASRLGRAPGGRSRLTIDLSLGKHGAQALAAESLATDPTRSAPLRFFVNHHSDPSVAPTLLLWIARHLARVSITDQRGEHIDLPLESIQPLAPNEHPVFPWPETSPLGYRSVVEYFSIPEKFHFFDVRRLGELEIHGSACSLHLDFESPPPLSPSLGARTIRLHCTPTVNLFMCPAEPIKRDPVDQRMLLRADDITPAHMEVYDVTSVRSYSQKHGEHHYHPHGSILAGAGSRNRYFSLHKEPSISDDGLDTYLEVSTSRSSNDEESLSIELLCTNRRLAERLRVGDVHGESQQALYSEYRNVTAVAPPAASPLFRDALWSLTSYLAIGQLPPANANALNRLLTSFDFAGRSSHKTSVFSGPKSSVITSLSRAPFTWIHEGVPIPATLIKVEIDDREFDGPGSIYMFGTMLEALFRSTTPLNSATKLELTQESDHSGFEWPTYVNR